MNYFPRLSVFSTRVLDLAQLPYLPVGLHSPFPHPCLGGPDISFVCFLLFTYHIRVLELHHKSPLDNSKKSNSFSCVYCKCLIASECWQTSLKSAHVSEGENAHTVLHSWGFTVEYRRQTPTHVRRWATWLHVPKCPINFGNKRQCKKSEGIIIQGSAKSITQPPLLLPASHPGCAEQPSMTANLQQQEASADLSALISTTPSSLPCHRVASLAGT